MSLIATVTAQGRLLEVKVSGYQSKNKSSGGNKKTIKEFSPRSRVRLLKLVSRLDISQEKYPVFILVALIPWQFHTGTLNSSAQSITGNAAIIKKVYFPRILLPLATMLSNLVNFLLASVVLLVLLFAFGVGLSIHALWVPLILLTQMVFLLGLGLIVATLHTFYRDTAMILEVGLLAWFFLTPIFYPFERLGTRTELFGIVFNQARLMRWLNPMASIVDSYRTVLWGNVGGNGPSAMDPLALLRTFITAVLIFIIGYIVFSRSEFLFGEKL